MEGRIGGLDQRDGLEGWTDKRMEGCRIVVIILFSRKAKFSSFRQKSFLAKSEIFAFSLTISAKNENDFRSYFREKFIFVPTLLAFGYDLRFSMSVQKSGKGRGFGHFLRFSLHRLSK